MVDKSTFVTTLLSLFLLGSYFFITSTKTNYDVLDCMNYAKQRLIKFGNHIGDVLFVPDDPVKKILLGLIYHEKRYIRAAVYQLTDPDLLIALLDAHHRGVTVEIITDKSCLQSKHEKITELRKQGILVYVYGEKHYSIMHNKFWVFEKNLCNKSLIWSGSANATISGTTRNEENVLVNDHYQTVALYKAKFDRLKNKIGVMTMPKIGPNNNTYQRVYLRFFYELKSLLKPLWNF